MQQLSSMSAKFLRRYENEPLVVVVSAMGKTTNALEAIMQAFAANDTLLSNKLIQESHTYHDTIIKALFPNESTEISTEIAKIFGDLATKCKLQFEGEYDYHYDQIISLGEVI